MKRILAVGAVLLIGFGPALHAYVHADDGHSACLTCRVAGSAVKAPPPPAAFFTAAFWVPVALGDSLLAVAQPTKTAQSRAPPR